MKHVLLLVLWGSSGPGDIAGTMTAEFDSYELCRTGALSTFALLDSDFDNPSLTVIGPRGSEQYGRYIDANGNELGVFACSLSQSEGG